MHKGSTVAGITMPQKPDMHYYEAPSLMLQP
jgi:hypothetical protein